MKDLELFNQHGEHFFAELNCVNRTLGGAIIKQMGGEDVFVDNYQDISYTGVSGYDGFFSRKDAIEFFNANEDNIRLAVSCIATENDFDSSFDFINHYRLEALGGFSDGFSTDDISMVVGEPQNSVENSSDARITYCTLMINACVSYMCEQYTDYLIEVQ